MAAVNGSAQAGASVVVAGRVADAAWGSLHARFPAVDFVRHPFDPAAGVRAAAAEALWTCGLEDDAFAELLAALPRLRWVHTCSAGVDRLQRPELARRGVRLTRTAVARVAPMAEYVVGMTLALLRRVPELIAAQGARRWQRLTCAGLAGATVGIVGAGLVGQAAARRFAAFDARVVGIRRRPGPLEGFAEVWGPERLDDLIPAADVLVLACALTPATHRLIDRRRLGAMKPTALLINVARGAVVDQAALVDALSSGALGGAALDVFEREPLAADDPLWALPNVILTPHHASAVPGVAEAVAAEFADNLARFLAGAPLADEVPEVP